MAGVFFGSLAWWFFLSGAVTVVRTRLPEGFATLVSRGSAFILIAFGMIALLHALLTAI